MSEQKKWGSSNWSVWEKMCLVDAFVYGLPVKAVNPGFLSAISRVFARFLSTFGGIILGC